jgi:hypothetical protein|tara:strand:+ start:45 stop:314 length:270 start_codon:yes stop_codon:yes gene_type:complete
LEAKRQQRSIWSQQSSEATLFEQLEVAQLKPKLEQLQTAIKIVATIRHRSFERHEERVDQQLRRQPKEQRQQHALQEAIRPKASNATVR